MNRFVALLCCPFALALAAIAADPPPVIRFAPTAAEANDAVEVEFRKLMARDDEAHAEIERLIKDNAAFAEKGAGLSAAAQSLKIEQRLAPIKEAYADFLRRHPRHARGFLAQGSFLNDAGDELAALASWQKALELDPDNPATHNNLANAYGAQDQPRKSFEHFTRAIELNPAEALYYHNFGSMVLLHKRAAADFLQMPESRLVAHALDLYQKAQRLNPDNFQLATDIAQAHYSLQPPNPDEALTAWRRALQLARDEEEREATRLHLARWLVTANRFAEARIQIQSVTHRSLTLLRDRLSRHLADREKELLLSPAPPAPAKSP